MKIRLAAGGDVPAICLLYEQFYAYNAAQQPDYCIAAKESGAYPQAVIGGEAGDIFIAEENGALLGFIHIEEEKTPPFASVAQRRYGCVVDLYVGPAHRRRGIGKALLAAAKAWSKGRGLEYLELFVLEENKAGIQFYEGEDFIAASRTMRHVL